MCKKIILILLLSVITPDLSLAGCDSIDFEKGGSSFFKFDGASCVKTSQDELSKKILNLLSFKFIHKRTIQQNCSDDTRVDSNSGDLQKTTKIADDLLNEYQYFNSAEIQEKIKKNAFDSYLSEFKTAYDKLLTMEEEKNKQSKSSQTSKSSGQDLLPPVVQALLQAKGLVDKTADQIFNKVVHAFAEQLRPSDHSEGKISLKKLSPVNPRVLVACQVGSGICRAGLGVTGVVFESLGAGLPLGLTAAGVNAVTQFGIQMADHMNQSRKETLGRQFDSGLSTRKSWTKTGKEAASEHAIDSLDVLSESSEVFSLISTFVPLLSPIKQLGGGAKDVWTAFMGDAEVNYVLSKQYEHVYQALLNATITEKLKKIEEIQKQLFDLEKFSVKTLHLSRYLDRSAENDLKNIYSKMNCLCQAKAWLENLKTESDKRFKHQYSHLDRMIKKQMQQEKVKNAIKGTMDKFKSKLKD